MIQLLLYINPHHHHLHHHHHHNEDEDVGLGSGRLQLRGRRMVAKCALARRVAKCQKEYQRKYLNQPLPHQIFKIVRL